MHCWASGRHVISTVPSHVQAFSLLVSRSQATASDASADAELWLRPIGKPSIHPDPNKNLSERCPRTACLSSYRISGPYLINTRNERGDDLSVTRAPFLRAEETMQATTPLRFWWASKSGNWALLILGVILGAAPAEAGTLLTVDFSTGQTYQTTGSFIDESVTVPRFGTAHGSH